MMKKGSDHQAEIIIINSCKLHQNTEAKLPQL
jgi:tRNA A37 methylthiotransferase MiaB